MKDKNFKKGGVIALAAATIGAGVYALYEIYEVVYNAGARDAYININHELIETFKAMTKEESSEQ